MSAQTIKLTGDLRITPDPAAAGNPPIVAALLESFPIVAKMTAEYTLGGDSAESVQLGDMTAIGVHGFYIRSTALITVACTWTGNPLQAIPATMFLLRNPGEPINTITIQREPGVATTVFVTAWQE